MQDAYRKADDVLLNAVRSIFDLVVRPGHINLDFADLKTAMSTRGYAMMGEGKSSGPDRAEESARLAIRSPLLDNVNIMNAKGVLINITGGADVTLRETEVITDVVNQIVDLEEGEVFFGTVFDPDARDEIRVTVIATGLTRNASDATEAKRRTHISNVAQSYSQQASHNTVVDEDDVPAINKRQEDGAPVAAPSSSGRSTPMSIQDYLKNQQRK
jgi:cell division protein FtsZ